MARLLGKQWSLQASRKHLRLDGVPLRVCSCSTLSSVHLTLRAFFLASCYLQDAYRLQLSMFLADVRCQVGALPGLRSALSLYSRISLTKLASLLDVDQDSIR